MFLNKKLTAIVLVTVFMISSFLTACRKPLVDSSTIQQNSSQSQVSGGTISSKEELTKPSIPNVSPESNFWSDNTDPEGVVVSDKNTFIINTANTGKTPNMKTRTII